jgi:hypothetical protein
MTEYQYKAGAVDRLYRRYGGSPEGWEALRFTPEGWPGYYRRSDGTVEAIDPNHLEPVSYTVPAKGDATVTKEKSMYRAHTESWQSQECTTLDEAIRAATKNDGSTDFDDCWVERDGVRILTIESVTTYHLVPESAL